MYSASASVTNKLKRLHPARYFVAKRVLSFVAVILLSACTTTPYTPPEPPPTVPDEPEVELTPAPEVVTESPAHKSELRLTIAAVGDMMLGTNYPENHLPDDDGVSFLSEVAPIISAADIAFGNLEGVLVDGGEPGKKC